MPFSLSNNFGQSFLKKTATDRQLLLLHRPICATINIRNFRAKIKELSKSNRIGWCQFLPKKNFMNYAIFSNHQLCTILFPKNGNRSTFSCSSLEYSVCAMQHFCDFFALRIFFARCEFLKHSHCEKTQTVLNTLFAKMWKFAMRISFFFTIQHFCELLLIFPIAHFLKHSHC